MSSTEAPPGYTPSPLMMVQPSAMNPVQQHTPGFTSGQPKTMKILSTLQIVIGGLCILLEIIVLAVHRSYYNRSYGVDLIGTGIWCGLIFTASGILGHLAVRFGTTSMVIATMVMSFVSSIGVWCVVGFSAVALGVAASYKGYCYYSVCPPTEYDGYMLADSLLIIFSIAEFIIAIWSSILCCKATCHCVNNSALQSTYYMAYPSGGQQVILMPQQGLNSQPLILVSQRDPLTGQQLFNGQPLMIASQQGQLLGQPGQLLGQPGQLLGQQGQLLGQQAVLTPSGSLVQEQTTHTQPTGGNANPAYAVSMADDPSPMRTTVGYRDQQKEPLMSNN